ncbi:MAG TPA: SDR family NAD(P)-dependent oxidoreductase [Steroidobacteraceae bacterium]|nr:SDR family NAD(P)-dependent oxidoreductase [Steroidobacteraceae bacterium]
MLQKVLQDTETGHMGGSVRGTQRQTRERVLNRAPERVADLDDEPDLTPARVRPSDGPVGLRIGLRGQRTVGHLPGHLQIELRAEDIELDRRAEDLEHAWRQCPLEERPRARHIPITAGGILCTIEHVISVSSIGVLSSAARFSAYNASKAALEAFTRCAAAEYHDRDVHFTVVNMRLVRTAMVAPSRVYERFPLLRPEQAADIVCEAIVRRPARLATPLGRLAQIVEALAPGLNRAVMSESYRLLPESEAAGGPPGAEERLAPETLAIAALLHGVRR